MIAAEVKRLFQPFAGAVEVPRPFVVAAWRDMAEKTIHSFDGQLERAPSAMPQMLVALDWLRSKPKQIVIAGKPGAPDTAARRDFRVP